MNLKKLMLASVFILIGGCDEQEVDQALVDKLWTKTVEQTGIAKDSPKPEIAIMDEDLYHKILDFECESKSGKSQEKCLEDRKELEDSVLLKTGKSYEQRYAAYIRSERSVLNEDCSKYSDKKKEKQCKADKLSKRSVGKILGRAFLGDRYLEIYYGNIWDYLDRRDRYYTAYHMPFSYAEKVCFFYSVVAHEMLHSALHTARVDVLDQHKQMHDKHMDPLLNFISDYEKADRKGFHRELAFGSLEVGIEGDEAAKRIRNRQNTDESGSENKVLVLPCGLHLK